MMVSLTINIDDNTLKNIENLNWVNWSELAREEIKKKIVFEKYIKTKEVSSEDLKFCKDIDWHPVDELPLKKSFIDKMKIKQSYKKINMKDINALIG